MSLLIKVMGSVWWFFVRLIFWVEASNRQEAVLNLLGWLAGYCVIRLWRL